MNTPQPLEALFTRPATLRDPWAETRQDRPAPAPDGAAAAVVHNLAGLLPTIGLGAEPACRWVWRLKASHGWRREARVVRRRLPHRRGVLVVGRGPLADTLVMCLQNSRRYRLVGWLDKELDGPASGGAARPVESGEDDEPCRRLELIAEREGASCVVVALPNRRGDLPLQQLLACRLRGIEVQDGMAFYERVAQRIALAGLSPGYLIFNGGFRWPSQLAKRALDLALSTLGLLLTAPLFVLLPFLIKLTSPGPVFYRQERAGLNGRRFTILKFRSMCDQAEQAGCPVWAQEADPRVTRIGHFMRKYRLDELPQMINVLRGEMSFVGPRPERPEFVALLAKEIPFYALRLSVKPGITGWAQVMFRYGATVEDAAEKLQYDLYYIKHMSLALDGVIAIKTIRTVLFRSGAR